MPFVKLDCGILDSTLWMDRSAREVFITALLMALPGEVTTSTPQLTVRSLRKTGWMVPPGWYGLIPAAGSGIIRRAGVKASLGLDALERLGEPEEGSRTPEFGGRRLVRIDGGYVVLNFMRYREHDETAAARMRRYRQRRKEGAEQVTRNIRHVTSRSDVADADADADAEAEAEIQRQSKSKSKAPRATARGKGAASHNEAAPVPGGAKVTWLTPFGAAWRTLYPDGEPPWKFMAKYLAPLTKKHSTEAICTQMIAYFEREGQFATWPKFASTFGNGRVVDRKIAAEDAQIIAMVRDQQNRMMP